MNRYAVFAVAALALVVSLVSWSSGQQGQAQVRWQYAHAAIISDQLCVSFGNVSVHGKDSREIAGRLGVAASPCGGMHGVADALGMLGFEFVQAESAAGNTIWWFKRRC